METKKEGKYLYIDWNGFKENIKTYIKKYRGINAKFLKTLFDNYSEWKPIRPETKNEKCCGNCNNYNPIQSQPTDTLEEKAKKIVEENFKGLADLNDEDIFLFYKELIKDCMVNIAQSPESFLFHLRSEKMKEIIESAFTFGCNLHVGYGEQKKYFEKYYSELTKTK